MQREKILKTAAHIFREKGYHGTSMQDIAHAVNLQKASLYHHIESKQDLLLELLDQALDGLIEELSVVFASDLDPDQKLREAVRRYVGRLTEHADLAAVLLLEYRSLDPDQRGKHITKRDHFEGLWRGILRGGMEAQSFRKMDVPLLSFAILGVLNWMITWYRQDGAKSAVELADEFTDFFLRGLQNDRGDLSP
jgi:AcrR family transcriptional regulator